MKWVPLGVLETLVFGSRRGWFRVQGCRFRVSFRANSEERERVPTWGPLETELAHGCGYFSTCAWANELILRAVLRQALSP